MPDNTAFAIIILAIVILVLGAPFALNEYSKWQEREQINRILNQPIIVEKPTTQVKTIISTIPTPTPPPQHKITDDYWCRNTLMSVNDVNKNVKDCYQFFSNGSYTHGDNAYPEFHYPMAQLYVNCHTVVNKDLTTEQACDLDKWKVNSKGEYEIWMKTFTLKGDTLTIAGEDPPYTWSSTGIWK